MSNLHIEWIPIILKRLESGSQTAQALVGYDGYVDRICKAVKSRSKEEVGYFPTLKDFGDKMHFAAGKSAQVELVPVATKLGGNAPIMAMALARLNFQTMCLGTLGERHIHQVFHELEEIAQVRSLGAPALTTALEFDDGKLILSDLSSFDQLDYDFIVERLGEGNLIQSYQSANLIAMVGWSNLPLARDFLESLSKVLIPQLGEEKRNFFFDLADTTRKSRADLLSMLESISYFNTKGSVTLGLNENEALHVHQVLLPGQKPENTTDLTYQLYEALGIDRILVHPVKCACLADTNGILCLDNRMVPDPRILTGAGDNLNAGFCLGLTMGMEKEACLILGMANSGAYIALGHSPDIHELIDYLKVWYQELELR